MIYTGLDGIIIIFMCIVALGAAIHFFTIKRRVKIKGGQLWKEKGYKSRIVVSEVKGNIVKFRYTSGAKPQQKWEMDRNKFLNLFERDENV